MGNVVREKSVEFSVCICKFYVYLKWKRLYEIADQLFRSWTSIWANIAEAQYAITPREFIAKLQISLKEWYETLYRFELLEQWFWENCLKMKEDCTSLVKLLTAIIKKTKENNNY